MLPRWLETLLTPCPLYLRRMGYLRELLDIKDRHHEWAEAWRPHLDNTLQLLLAAVEQCRQRRKAVVFGSGLLLDVPLTAAMGLAGWTVDGDGRARVGRLVRCLVLPAERASHGQGVR